MLRACRLGGLYYRGGRKQEGVAAHTSGSTRCRGHSGLGCGVGPELSRCRARTKFRSSAGRTTCSTWQHQQPAKSEAESDALQSGNRLLRCVSRVKHVAQ